MVEGRNITTRDRTVTIMEARADQTIEDVRVQMTLRMIAPMGSLVQRTARVPAHQMIAATVEGTDIAVEGRNITTARDHTIMETRVDPTIAESPILMNLRMTSPMGSLVQRTAVLIPSLQVTAQTADQIAVTAAPKAGLRVTAQRVTAAGPRVIAV